MTAAVVFADRRSALDYEQLCRRARAIPNRVHRHVGGGRHVDVHPTTPGPGWATAWSDVREHPTRTEFAVAALSPTKVMVSRTTQQEREALADEFAVREPLDETWQSSEREGGR